MLNMKDYVETLKAIENGLDAALSKQEPELRADVERTIRWVRDYRVNLVDLVLINARVKVS